MADLGSFATAIWGMLEVIKNFIISQVGIVAFICFFIGILAAKLIGSLKGFIILVIVGSIILLLVGSVLLLATGATPEDLAGKASTVPSVFGNAIDDIFADSGEAAQANATNNSGGESGEG